MIPLYDRLVSIIRSTAYEHAQNKLMACSDREIAIALLYTKDEEKDFIFSLIAKSKSMRIKEELRLLKRVKVTYEQYTLIISMLIKRFEGNGERLQSRSYLKPRKKYR
ncbi:MAG: hypothetical protein OQK82_06475 [Candidatus Pacearchaeota archaeon]|nr:hypothetical protein [Candidatus Pacearchaeota archaeon]